MSAIERSTHDPGDGRGRDGSDRDRPLSRSLSLEGLVAWLTREVFGPKGGDWLNDVMSRHEIKTSQGLMRLLAVKWPRLIASDGRDAATKWLSKVVCEDFLRDAPPRLFPSLVYQTLLDRQPTAAEAQEATEIAEAAGPDARVALFRRLTKTEEYRRSSQRRALLPSGRETQAVFDARRDQYLAVGCRIPDAVPESFFDLGHEMEDADKVPLKGFVCARYDGTYNRLITDPNVSVVGVGIGGNRFRVARDWLVLGPRVTLSPGDYTIVVDVAFEGDTEATVDLVAAFGTRQLLSLTFRENLRSIIPVRIEETVHAVELRMLNHSSDTDVMQLNELGIYLRPAGRHRPGSSVASTLPPATTVPGARDPAQAPAGTAGGGLARLFGRGRPKDALKATHKFVSATREFDRDWYARQYPDVAAAGWDPLKHFLAHGMREGRLPNERFDAIAFAETAPEHARSETLFLDYLKRQHPALAKRYL